MLHLLVLFPFGIVLLALLAGLPLGGYLYLVIFLILSLQLLGLLGRLLLIVLLMRCLGLVGRKRIRLNRRTPAHFVVSMVQSRPRVWKRLRHLEHSSVSIPDHKRRRGDQDDG